MSCGCGMKDDPTNVVVPSFYDESDPITVRRSAEADSEAVFLSQDHDSVVLHVGRIPELIAALQTFLGEDGYQG